uniref:Uncharacterized protein n=1 Tax=Glycine max TaxID=3847 RepID=A0A0R0EVE7_SOYBN
MENNKKKVGGGSSSSSFTNFDHLFGPKDPSTTSSSSTSIFGSIFPPPSTVGGRDSTKQDTGCKNYGAPVTKVKAALAVSPTTIILLVPIIIRMRQWSPATTVHQSIMVVKKIIPQEPGPLNPTIFLRKIRMMMIQMVMIQTVLQGGTGGKVLFIINICQSMQARHPVYQDDSDMIDHVRCTQ